jgi:hypothetical protein
MSRSGRGFFGVGGRTIVLIVLLVNITIGAVCFDYSLKFVFDKDIPWYGDCVCGLFLGEVAVPAAIICWVLGECDVQSPLVGN